MSKFVTKTIITAGDVSGNLTSSTVNLQNNYGFAVQCSFTGSPSGTVLVEGSNDQINWSTIDTLTVAALAVLASNKDAIYWPYVRVTKAAGGTGTMTTTITVKGA
jgi:hypothetical protein